MKKPKHPDNTSIIVLLIVMIVSTFIAVPVNGGDKGWWSVWGIELDAFCNIFHLQHVTTDLGFSSYLGILLGVVHLAIFSLPFLTGKEYFAKVLIWLPLLYLALTAITFFFFLILLVPFTVFWVIILLVWRRDGSHA